MNGRHELLVDFLLEFQAVRVVLLDQLTGKIEDILSGPVIDVQNDFRVIRVNLPETVNIAQGCAPETEYALVIIAADSQVPVLGSQELEELELDIVRILEFIDKYIFVFLLKLFQKGRPVPEKVHDQQDLVLEIDLPSLHQ